MSIGIAILSIIGLLGLLYKIKESRSNSISFLKLKSINFNISESTLKIFNHGPGLAKEVKITTYNETLINSTKKIKGEFRCWFKLISIIAEGPDEIKANDSKKYRLKHDLPILNYPIFIKWKSIKNLKQNNAWKIDSRSNKLKVNQIVRFEIYFYKLIIQLKRLKYSIKKKEKCF